jgi:uncharacterized protein YdaU (DUF1376 family)
MAVSMNYYPHHIGDFNSATRHLTRIERSIYRDMIEMYYDTEQALPLDVKALCRKLMARSEEEVTAVEQVLNEFFTVSEQGWMHARCEAVIEEYHKKLRDKSEAGKASAAARAAKAGAPKATPVNDLQQAQAAVQQVLDSCSTNQEPITNNHKPEEKNKEPQDAPRLLAFDQFWKAYPKKTGKGDAEKAFKKAKVTAELLDTILKAIEAQKKGKGWLEDDGKYIPNPATWLNGKRWEDEVAIAVAFRPTIPVAPLPPPEPKGQKPAGLDLKALIKPREAA